jgi:hypothetical protein
MSVTEKERQTDRERQRQTETETEREREDKIGKNGAKVSQPANELSQRMTLTCIRICMLRPEMDDFPKGIPQLWAHSIMPVYLHSGFN